MTKIALTMTMLVMLLFGGCGTSIKDSVYPNAQTGQSGVSVETSIPTKPTTEKSSQVETPDALKTNILIAYFSRTGENYGVGYIEKGNTSIVADIIAEQTGGDLFEIRTVATYPDNYDEATEIAKQERNENARPELANNLEDISDYDTVFIGYPIWWGDMPMAVYTFFESHDFSDKTIIPFCTHAGSGLSSTESSISNLTPNATMADGFSILGSTAQNNQEETKNEVIEWLQQNDIVE